MQTLNLKDAVQELNKLEKKQIFNFFHNLKVGKSKKLELSDLTLELKFIYEFISLKGAITMERGKLPEKFFLRFVAGFNVYSFYEDFLVWAQSDKDWTSLKLFKVKQ